VRERDPHQSEYTPTYAGFCADDRKTQPEHEKGLCPNCKKPVRSQDGFCCHCSAKLG